MTSQATEQTYKVLSTTLTRLLRPLVRLMLRNGVTFQAFTELVKVLFVDVAAKEFLIAGRKQSDSRISVITGLTRKEVKRITQADPPDDVETFVRYNRAARVISGWIQDPDFIDRHGNPRDIPIDGNKPHFAELVRRYSGDAPARAVLDELERVGAVARMGSNKLTLLTRAYVPQTDDAEKIAILGVTTGNLIDTIEQNFWGFRDEPLFQRSIADRKISAAHAAEFHLLARRKSQQILEMLDQWLSEREIKDRKQSMMVDTKNVGLGVYYFEEK